MKSIDIHGYLRSEGELQLVGFVKESYLNREFFILIIHGVGQGILKEMVHANLKKNKYVEKFEIAPPQIGGSGATLCYLKKRGYGAKTINT